MPKPVTSYTPVSKPATPYETIAKNSTPYHTGAPADSLATWLLNSTIVTLNSLTAHLNGYFVASVPNQISTKSATPYEAI